MNEIKYRQINALMKKLVDLQKMYNNLKRNYGRQNMKVQVRQEILERQQNKCNCCSCEISEFYQIDHAVALQFGGNNESNNLQALCYNCHGRKTILERRKRKEIKEAIHKIIYSETTDNTES